MRVHSVQAVCRIRLGARKLPPSPYLFPLLDVLYRQVKNVTAPFWTVMCTELPHGGQ